MRYDYLTNNNQPALKCPDCESDWTEKGSIILAICIGGKEIELETRLNKAGSLVDIQRVVRNGYHSETICNCCGNPIAQMDGVNEYPDEEG